jgi:superfamily I DNA/RNA helicase
MVGGLYSVLTCLDLEEKFYDLTENYRNTVQIEKLAKIFGNNYTANSITLNKYTATRNGEKPILYKSSSIQDTVNNIIDFYLNHPNTFISVLMPRMSSGYKDLFMSYKTAFEEAISKSSRKPNFFYYFGGEKNIPNFEKSGIYLMTFKNSKGLEFDYVYLIEMNNANACLTQSIDRNGVYVALTRARENAFIVYDPKEDINSLISLMFDAKVQDDSIFEEKDIKSANTVRKVFI